MWKDPPNDITKFPVSRRMSLYLFVERAPAKSTGESIQGSFPGPSCGGAGAIPLHSVAAIDATIAV
jgi:hypothetical protein